MRPTRCCSSASSPRAGYAVQARRIQTANELRDALAEPNSIDLVLADYTLPSFGARDALAIIQKSRRRDSVHHRVGHDR